MDLFVVVGHVLQANVEKLSAFEPKIDIGKGAACMARVVKIVKGPVQGLYLHFTCLAIDNEICSTIIFKLEQQARLGSERYDEIRPATMGTAGIAFQNDVGCTVAVDVLP